MRLFGLKICSQNLLRVVVDDLITRHCLRVTLIFPFKLVPPVNKKRFCALLPLKLRFNAPLCPFPFFFAKETAKTNNTLIVFVVHRVFLVASSCVYPTKTQSLFSVTPFSGISAFTAAAGLQGVITIVFVTKVFALRNQAPWSVVITIIIFVIVILYAMYRRSCSD